MVERKVFGLKVRLLLAIGLLSVTRHSIRCKQSSIPMRLGTGLSRAEFTLLARLRATSRATDNLYLFESPRLAHRSLPFRGNGHGSTLQKADDQCAIYLQAAVVADEALLPEPIHKFTYPCAGGTNHLRQGSLAHLQGILRL